MNLKCPYCGFESDICDFPDYFDGDKEMQDILDEHLINIVCCGMCGKPIVQEKFMEKE